MSELSEVQAAVVTAPGLGAIAVLRIRGRGALSAVDRLFRPHRGRALANAPDRALRVGRIGGPEGEEVVVAVIDRASDPAGSATLEIQCHGGEAAVRRVLGGLAGRGVRIVDAGALVRAEYGSRLAAEGWMALAEAATERAAGILLDQAQGALEGGIRGVLEMLPGRADGAIARVDELLVRSRVGLRLVAGWSVVLVGRPNVGKSRLLNALAGRERAIVSEQAGTTRDVLSVRTALGGWPAELIDTAGQRASDDPLEREGVDRARVRQSAADLVIVVLDRSVPLVAEDRAVLEAAPGAVRVANKADRPPAWEAGSLGAFEVSAAMGSGLDALERMVAGRLVPTAIPAGAAVPFTEAQVRRLRRCRALLVGGRVEAGSRGLRALVEPRAGRR